MRCAGAPSGDDALRQLHEAARAADPFQIVLIDYLMPGENGEQLARTIKAEPELRDAGLVMFTAAGGKDLLEVCAEQGFSGYVAKPVRVNQLVEVLAAVCGSGRAGAADVWSARTSWPPPRRPRPPAGAARASRCCSPRTTGSTRRFKFTDEGGRVQLWARHDPEAAQIVIGVTENGLGIAPDNLRAIFERFRQVGDLQKSAKGFGLGLAIVKELVELNLGDVSVESREGEGSTFWFTVPTTEPLPLLRRFLAFSQRLRSGSRYLTLIAVDLDAQSDGAALSEVDNLLRRTLRFADLVFPAHGHRWLLVAAIERPDPSGIHRRIAAALEDANRQRSGSPLPLPEITGLGTWSLAEGGAALTERFEAEYSGAPRCSRLAHHAA